MSTLSLLNNIYACIFDSQVPSTLHACQITIYIFHLVVLLWGMSSSVAAGTEALQEDSRQKIKKHFYRLCFL